MCTCPSGCGYAEEPPTVAVVLSRQVLLENASLNVYAWPATWGEKGKSLHIYASPETNFWKRQSDGWLEQMPQGKPPSPAIPTSL